MAVNYSPFVRLSRKASASMHLFCFPCAGANAWMYRPWAGGLPGGVELHALQLPGRGTRMREAPFRSLEPLLEEAARALPEHSPYAFFGHSLGATIAFELSRLLARQGRRAPAHLFVSGCRAPHLPRVSEPIHDLPHQQFLERVRGFDGIDPLLFATELETIIVAALRDDFRMAETWRYVPGPPLECPITVLGGDADPHVPAGDLQEWAVHTRGNFSAHIFPGSHFYLRDGQESVLACLSAALNALPAARRVSESASELNGGTPE